MVRNRAIRALVDAEQRGDLWRRRVLGYPVWPHERLYRWRDEQFADVPDFVPLHRQGLHKMAARIARPVASSMGDLVRGGPASRPGRDIWVLSSTAYRRQAPDGADRCIYADHLRRQLGDRLLFLETNASHRSPAARDDVIHIDALMAAAMAAGQMMAPAMLLSRSLRRALRAFAPTPPVTICRDAVYGRLLQAAARRWMERARPRALFVLCAYNFFIPFQRAARELGIPIIELQHGIIYESHPGYIYDDTPELPHFPDHIVVFGRHFGEMLERECVHWRGRWSVGGHPWLSGRGESDRDADSVVLFSAPDAATRTVIAGVVPELRAALDDSTRVVIKPHPLELDAAEHYGALATAGVDIAGALDDTYELLERCQAAITVNSTVAMEALVYRCRSIVLRTPYWTEDIRALVEQGALEAADTGAEIAELCRVPPTDSRRGDVASRLFGIGEPAPDFATLIERVRATRRQVV